MRRAQRSSAHIPHACTLPACLPPACRPPRTLPHQHKQHPLCAQKHPDKRRLPTRRQRLLPQRPGENAQERPCHITHGVHRHPSDHGGATVLRAYNRVSPEHKHSQAENNGGCNAPALSGKPDVAAHEGGVCECGCRGRQMGSGRRAWCGLQQRGSRSERLGAAAATVRGAEGHARHKHDGGVERAIARGREPARRAGVSLFECL